jgi:hypothetical protein
MEHQVVLVKLGCRTCLLLRVTNILRRLTVALRRLTIRHHPVTTRLQDLPEAVSSRGAILMVP